MTRTKISLQTTSIHLKLRIHHAYWKVLLYSGKQIPSQAYGENLSWNFPTQLSWFGFYCTLKMTLPLDLWNSMTNINCSLLQGDSGGPLVCERPRGQWTLFGLTSWGSVCVSKVLGPGVYSNVSYFVEWIERQIYIKTFLQKEFQGWAETLPATHTSTALLTMKSALPRATRMGFRGQGAQCALQDLLFAPDPFFSAFYFFSSFIIH